MNTCSVFCSQDSSDEVSFLDCSTLIFLPLITRHYPERENNNNEEENDNQSNSEQELDKQDQDNKSKETNVNEEADEDQLKEQQFDND